MRARAEHAFGRARVQAGRRVSNPRAVARKGASTRGWGELAKKAAAEATTNEPRKPRFATGVVGPSSWTP